MILFDEIEKAHPEVFNVLLQVLDDGRLTDGHGRTVDFRNTVVIMTSNLGTARRHARRLRLQRRAHDAATPSATGCRRTSSGRCASIFRPEFLNRIDEIIVFEPLTEDGAAADRRHHAATRCASGWRSATSTLELTDAAKEALVHGRLRPGLRRAAAAPHDRAPHREPAVEAHPRRRVQRGRHGDGRLRRRRVRLRQEGTNA